MTNRCVILGAAPVSDVEALRDLLLPDDDFVAADGGWHLAQALGVTPRALIADFDSMPACDLPEGVELVRLPVEKDVTDTAAAADWAMAVGYHDFLFLGCTGGRLDHQYAALLKAVQMAGSTSAFCRVSIADERNSVHPMVHGVTSEMKGYSQPDRKLSLFAFGGPVTGLTVSGVAYPLVNFTLLPDNPLCVSNEFSGDEYALSFESGTLLVYFTKD